MYQPLLGMVVTITLEFLDKCAGYSYVSAVLLVASQPRPSPYYKVFMCFLIQ
jgi:hypothetical protein